MLFKTSNLFLKIHSAQFAFPHCAHIMLTISFRIAAYTVPTLLRKVGRHAAVINAEGFAERLRVPGELDARFGWTYSLQLALVDLLSAAWHQ